MTESPADFATLLARARDGDRTALDRLARDYEPKLRLVARVLLGPALRPYLDTVDLVQSVHKSLMVGLRDRRFAFDTPDDMLALAVTLVRRKAARQWRTLQRQKRLSGGGTGREDLAFLLKTLSRPQDDPAREAAFSDGVRELCRNLNDAERRLLELRSQGYSPTEIAADLGLSDVAFRVRLTRLRQRLRAAGILDDWL
jgi:RNA polymerase sigma-70 factor (ECF subfamily)